MRWRQWIAALTLAAATAGCQGPEEELTRDVSEQIAHLRKEKAAIDQKVRDLEAARTVLEESTTEALNRLHRSIETIQNALDNMQKSLDSIEGAPVEITSKPRRLSIQATAILVVIIVLSIATALKLRQMRQRELRGISSEDVNRDEQKSAPKT